jgi:hypothetical protein
MKTKPPVKREPSITLDALKSLIELLENEPDPSATMLDQLKHAIGLMEDWANEARKRYRRAIYSKGLTDVP